MQDAVAVPCSLGLAIAATVGLASAPTSVELTERTTSDSRPAPSTDATCSVTGLIDPDARRALELACLKYGDARYPFQVFSIAELGERRAVFAKRSTGECGGCGALAVAVIFRNGDVEAVEKLGEFGRFGNGPDVVRFIRVAGYPAVEVDETISMGGYTNAYREWFILDRGRLEWRLCINYEGSDAGARANASEWKASPWIANDGTFYASPSYTKRGEDAPQLYAYALLFDRGRWQLPEHQGRCIDPHR
jgi:hypothetical protein